jgi:Ca-activated chloride channel family protein
MHYADPRYLTLAFFASAALAAFYLWALLRKERLINTFAEKDLVGGIAPTASLKRLIVKTVMMLAAVTLAIFALARPQWGFEWQEVKRVGLDMLIAIDVSKSMLANDVKPNRLERTKFAVKDLVKKLNGDRVGLIAFAGSAFLQCPLTIDYNGFLLALDDLSVETIPRGGTSISSAIRMALETLSGQDKKYKVMVIITDGEDFEGDAVKMAAEAAKEGLKIYCLGVGTSGGELIPAGYEGGARAYLTDRQGNVVKTRLNEEILKRIAISTGGSYVRATQSDFGLGLMYDKSISQLEKRDRESKMKKQYEERFQIFLAAALLLVFLESLVAERKRGVQ